MKTLVIPALVVARLLTAPVAGADPGDGVVGPPGWTPSPSGDGWLCEPGYVPPSPEEEENEIVGNHWPEHQCLPTSGPAAVCAWAQGADSSQCGLVVGAPGPGGSESGDPGDWSSPEKGSK